MSIKRKRWLPSLFLLVFALTALLNVVPQHVFAGAKEDQLRAESEVYTSLKSLRFQCVSGDGDIRFKDSFDKATGDETIDDVFNNMYSGSASGSQKRADVGEHVEPVDGIISCQQRSEMEPVLRKLGFANAKEYIEFFFKTDPNDSSKYILKDPSKDQGQLFFDYVNGKAEKGPDGNIDSLSNGARYWLYVRNLDVGGCRMREYDSSRSDPHKKIWLVQNGELVNKDMQVITNEDANIGRGGVYNNGKDNRTRIECSDLMNRLENKDLAQAYYDAMQTDKANGEAASASNDPGADGEATSPNAECESTGFASAWILCPIYNMVADTTAFFYNSILQPFLYTPPVNVNPSSPSYQAWSTFRFYGNMFLVIAMIIIVFGQSIGGGLIDAYTAKKVMPRLLAAAVMINLSVYIVAILVDITNAIGVGIASLIMSPFGDQTFTTNGAQAVTAIASGVLGLILSGGTIFGFLGAATSGGSGQLIIMLALVVVIPALIALAGVFITLVIRRGLILALVMISPIAFALYCLPNTEKYFRKWWDLLLKALLVYPIIMIIFAIANVMSLTILESSPSGASGGVAASGLAGLIAFAVQIIPLFMIPFAFKFAGGAIGSLYAAIQGGGQKAGGLLKTRQDLEKKRANSLMLQSRQRQYDRLGRFGDRAPVGVKGASRFLQNRVGGYNLHGALAEATAERFKAMDAQKDTGIDDEQRALTVNKRVAEEREGALAAAALRNGTDFRGQHMRVEGGVKKYRTLGGNKWVTENAVDAAQTRWGGDMAAMQWALGYEMSKATTQEDQDYLYQNYGRLNQAGSGLNLSEGQMAGMWQGAAFAKQNTDRQWKHYGWSGSSNGGALRSNGLSLMREIDERQGTYAQSQQHADTWRTMREEYERAQDTLTSHNNILRQPGGALSADQQRQNTEAREVVQRAQRIANSYSTQMPQGGVGQQIGVGPNNVPVPAQGGGAAGGAAGGRWVVSPTGAPAATQEEIGNFVGAVLTGVNPRDSDAPGYGRQDGLPNRAGGRRPNNPNP